METTFIAKVRKIGTIKTPEGENVKMNIVIIDTTNNKPSIVRNFSQFLQDLKNSFLIDENVTSMNHPQILRTLKGLKRGRVSGDVQYSKKGDKWTVNENSRCVTDPTHPQFGSVSIGDTLTVETPRAIIDGFLDFEVNSETNQQMLIADSVASATQAMQGVFEDFDAVVTNNSSNVENDTSDIPPEIMNGIVSEETASNEDEPSMEKVSTNTAAADSSIPTD